jgi:predicted secreted hydrolase
MGGGSPLRPSRRLMLMRMGLPVAALATGDGSRLVMASTTDSLTGHLPVSATALSRVGPGYPRVVPRPLVFPRDFGGHAAFRTEWWYMTGWLVDGDSHLGFQVTFFRSRTQHPDSNPSRFAPRQLMFAHAALALPSEGRLRVADRVARAGVAGAVFSDQDTDLRMEGWSLVRSGPVGQDVYTAEVSGSDFSLRLDAAASLPPLLRGLAGVSAKGPEPRHASYYYSRPHLRVRAHLGLPASPRRGPPAVDRRSLSGVAWLDHEWSSSLLMAGASGWDWIGIHLDDGGSLMAFRIRGADDRTLWTHWDHRRSDGTLIARDAAVNWAAVALWRSPRSLNQYPVEMSLEHAGRRYQLRPLMHDQEVDARASTGGYYWEGAVWLLSDGRTLGRGYLELTGYGQPLQL